MLNRTELRFDLVPIWEAFFALNACRDFDAQVGIAKPLRFSDIDAAAERFGVFDFRYFLRMISALDREYLSNVNRKK